MATSADGTAIAVHRSGEGTPLLLVHGALSDHTTWAAIAPYLESRRTLLAIDRRGRGESGDNDEYAFEREVDDLFAAIAGLHAEVDVLGHSSGAVIALRAAERGLPVRRLVLYEPPLMSLRHELPMPGDLADRLRALVESEERDEAVVTFLREGVGAPEKTIQAQRGSSRWPGLLAQAHTVVYDTEATSRYVLEERRLRAVRLPVLLLLGGTSPEWLARGTDALVAGLPDARKVMLEGQGHNAMFSAPELMAAEVLRFLEGEVASG